MNSPKNKKTLFLPIEIIARELDSKLLLAYKALDKGYSVVVGTKGAVKKIARDYGSGIYFYKDHSPLSSLLLQELHAAGLKIAVLDEEGLVWPSSKVYTKRIDESVLRISQAIFAWGQKQYDVLTNIMEGHKAKIHIVGNPRFDILHSKYRPFLKDQSKHHLLLMEEGYVLINSNFTPGNWNPLMYGTPSYVEHLLNRGFIHNDVDFSYYTKVSEYTAKLLDVYVSLLQKLSKSFPNTRFVMRPHPDENQERWHKIFASNHNVIVENSGSAIYWIMGAKALIYTGCTTGIEAWAMNKPTLRFNPFPESEFEPYLPNKFGKTIKTEKEMVEAVKTVLSSSGDNRFDVDPDYVTSYIKNGFTADAAENIVRVLDSFCAEDEHSVNTRMVSFAQLKKQIRLLLYFDIKKRWRQRLLGKLKRTLQQKDVVKESKIDQAKAQKFPGLTRKDIEMRLISLDKIIGKQKEQKREITKIAPNTFKIENHYT